jgi:hypothetical protein
MINVPSMSNKAAMRFAMRTVPGGGSPPASGGYGVTSLMALPKPRPSGCCSEM